MAGISVRAGAFQMRVMPEAGGSLAALTWQGHDLLRPQAAPGVLGSSCFPLVPFSNRIAGSRFAWGGHDVQLPPNHPEHPHEPVLHGLGWLLPWHVGRQTEAAVTLALEVPAGAWPWALGAELDLALTDSEARFTLALVNRSAEPMPAGLGFHPFFPRTPATLFHGLHKGEWQTDAACLPTRLVEAADAHDWWQGRPVASRSVDTVYTGRDGPLTIRWPERGIGLAIVPDDALAFTTVYVPPDQPFFCVEPVSHITDGFNRPAAGSGVRALAPGERWAVSMALTPFTMR
jgi:aldose 1-epimerase